MRRDDERVRSVKPEGILLIGRKTSLLHDCFIF